MRALSARSTSWRPRHSLARTAIVVTSVRSVSPMAAAAAASTSGARFRTGQPYCAASHGGNVRGTGRRPSPARIAAPRRDGPRFAGSLIDRPNDGISALAFGSTAAFDLDRSLLTRAPPPGCTPSKSSTAPPRSTRPSLRCAPAKNARSPRRPVVSRGDGTPGAPPSSSEGRRSGISCCAKMPQGGWDRRGRCIHSAWTCRPVEGLPPQATLARAEIVGERA